MRIEEKTIRVLISCAGLPQKKIARRMRISTTYLCNLIKGRRPWQDDLLVKFCKIVKYPTPKALLKNQKVILAENYDC